MHSSSQTKLVTARFISTRVLNSGVTRNRLLAIVALASSAALSGCYVVPVHVPAASGHPTPSQVPTGAGAPIVNHAPLTLAVRMYPTNDLAAPYGTISGAVVTDMNGRGTFSTAIQGEYFTGEATRLAGSSREGLANGTGNRGSFLNCRYQMNNTTLGSGLCRLSNGALFSMHIGS